MEQNNIIANGIQIESLRDYIDTTNPKEDGSDIDYNFSLKKESYKNIFNDLKETDNPPEIVLSINQPDVVRLNNNINIDREIFNKILNKYRTHKNVDIEKSINQNEQNDFLENFQNENFAGVLKDSENIQTEKTLKKENNTQQTITNTQNDKKSIIIPIKPKSYDTNKKETSEFTENENVTENIDEIESQEREKYNKLLDGDLNENFDEELLETSEAEVEEITEEVDDISLLVNNIDKDKKTIKSKVKVDIESIDKTISSKTENTIIEEKKDEESEIFGVKKAEIYYNIDKQIYGKRSLSKLDISKLRNIKSGILVPLVAGLLPLFILFVSLPVLINYFNKSAIAALEENIKTDNSILAKIAKQKEEEARKMKEKLEEELKRMSEERNRIEISLNEELAKKIADIEKEYKIKLQDLMQLNLPSFEFNKRKTKLDNEKAQKILEAQRIRDKKLQEQDMLLSKKNQEIENIANTIKQAIENKDFEIEKIKSNLSKTIEEKNREKEEVANRLEEIRNYNEKVKNFNNRVYQLISSAIDDFKNKQTSSGIARLTSVVQLYDSQKSFVNNDEMLNTKMITDLFFINTITELVNSTQTSLLYDKEFLSTLNKLKTINELYKNGETNFLSRNYNVALQNYRNVLKEFEVVNSSYERLRLIEKELDNNRALKLYNDSLVSMKAGNYQEALTYLTTLIKETPNSEYTPQAVDNITMITMALKEQSVSSDVDAKARSLYNLAQDFEKNNKINEAINTYKNIISEYPNSSFTKNSLNRLIALLDLTGNKNLTQFEESLRKQFQENYKNFEKFYKEKNIKEARKYYFLALKNAFDTYAYNSIDNFINVEDEYILSLLNQNQADKEALNNKILEEAKASLEKKYLDIINQKEKELMAKTDEYNLKISELEKKYNNEKNSIIQQYEEKIKQALQSGDKQKIEALQKEYETKLAEKDKQINELKSKPAVDNAELEKLKKQYDESLIKKDQEIALLKKEKEELLKNKNVSSSKEVEKLKNEYLEKVKELENEKKYINNLQNQLVEAYKKNEELAKNAELLVKESNEKLVKELEDIKNKYAQLERQASKARLTEEQLRKQITEEVKRDLEKTVQLEKERLQNEFSKEIAKLKDSQTRDINKGIQETEKTQILSDKYIARVIEVIDDSITFQYLSDNFIQSLSPGNRVKIVRIINNQEKEIANMIVTYTSNYSLFGRGRLSDDSKGTKILTTDLIRK